MSIESIPSYSGEGSTNERSNIYKRVRRVVYKSLPSSLTDKIRSVIHPEVEFGREPVEIECAGLKAKMQVNNWSDYYIVYGDHDEAEVVEQVIGSLKNKRGGGVFWDVGAAQGIYSIFAGQVAGSVVCVEPNVNHIPSLAANLDENNIKGTKSEILVLALADENCQRTIYFDKEHLLDTSLAKTRINLREKMFVNVCTIDSLIGEGTLPPTDIKIDVEGAEGMVLKGASNLLTSTNRPQDLFIEFHPEFLPLFDTSFENEFKRVIDNGYLLAAHKERQGQVLCHFTSDN